MLHLKEGETYWQKTVKGTWVKSVFHFDGIELLWQPNVYFKNGEVEIHDFNGDIEASVPVAEFSFESRMRSAGKTRFSERTMELAEFCYGEFCYGVMRHMAHLFRLGAGETPSDIVELFSDLRSLTSEYDDTVFRFVDSSEMFPNFANLICLFGSNEDGDYIDVDVAGQTIRIDMSPELLINFISITIPE